MIVKGFSGTKITPGIAFIMLVFLWAYSVAVCIPPFLGWGKYAPEGLLVTCSYDYLKTDWNSLTFLYYAFAFNYTLPVLSIAFFYAQVSLGVSCMFNRHSESKKIKLRSFVQQKWVSKVRSQVDFAME